MEAVADRKYKGEVLHNKYVSSKHRFNYSSSKYIDKIFLLPTKSETYEFVTIQSTDLQMELDVFVLFTIFLPIQGQTVSGIVL